jgi:hypothetical protein
VVKYDKTVTYGRHMKRRVILALMFILACGLLTGCGVEKGKAENVANAYFDAIISSDFNKAITYYSEKVFEKSSREEALQTLEETQKRYGDLISYKQTKWSIIHSSGKDGIHPKGNLYVFTYDLNYTRYSATLAIGLFQPDSSDTILISGLKVTTKNPIENLK